MRSHRFSFLFLISILLSSLSAGARTQKALNASEIELAIRKLNVVGTALYVAAHPDDENTALLAWLSNEKLVRAGYLSLTRGDGGQNLIGTEKGDLLGMIRTQELLAARRIDGSEQFFTRAIDFGYSKSPEETFTIWNREKLLSDVVWVIREFQPDVIITRFPANGDGGHGQHTASAVLAEEAFNAAADPARFPEQLSRVKPWQAKRIFWNAWRPQVENRPASMPQLLTIDLGTFNPLLGESYSEFAARSRSMHKSQGFGSPERRGALPNYLELRGGEKAGTDPFENIDLTWGRVPGGQRVGQILQDVLRNFDSAKPSSSVPGLIEAWKELKKLPSSAHVSAKREELADVIRGASGLWMELAVKSPTAVPGSTVEMEFRAVNRSDIPVQVVSIRLPFGGGDKQIATTLRNNEFSKTDLSATIPQNAGYTQPYWLQTPTDGQGLYAVPQQNLIGRADQEPAISTTAQMTFGDQPISFDLPAVYRWTDRVRGDLSRPFVIAPPVTMVFDKRVYVFPTAANRALRVRVRSSGGDVSGQLRLKLPPGWGSKPEVAAVTLKKGEEKSISFAVSPSSSEQSTSIVAEFSVGDNRYSRGMIDIDYDHIQPQTLFPEAAARAVRVDLRTGKESVGYIMGSGDDIPAVLEQIGYSVTPLSDADLANGDLGRYDTIIVGIRAYNTREALKQQHGRLMEFVKAGGTMIVQYNTNDDTLAADLGPYPFKVSRDRVTVENAPVTLLDASSPLLSVPNRITEKDFNGWVQERGLYFPSDWDASYQPVVSSHDPGEADLRGGTLLAKYGTGTYIYTGYSWFRQLPAAVPGAYRLFVNMISAGHASSASR